MRTCYCRCGCINEVSTSPSSRLSYTSEDKSMYGVCIDCVQQWVHMNALHIGRIVIIGGTQYAVDFIKLIKDE